MASTGYFPIGWGTISKGMAGAGVALDGRSPLAGANNPAAILTVADQELQLDLFLAYPMPKVNIGDKPTSSSSFPALHPGSYASDPNVPFGIFAIPQLGMNWRIGDKLAVALVIYGNGGLNDTYPTFANPDCPAGTSGEGLFCGGTVELDLKQVFISPTFAARVTPWLRVGLSPIIAVESFKIRGLGVFAANSVDPKHVSDTGRAYSIGYGYKLGLQIRAADGLSFGAVYQTKIVMDAMDRYSGLLPNAGRLDIPSYVELGLAWKFWPDWTLAFDWQRVFYSDSAALSNDPDVPYLLGSAHGPGFGWQNVNSYKLGIRWEASKRWIFRGGYARVSPIPVQNDELFFNIIAQSVTRDHFTAGATWNYSANSSLDVAVLYSPRNSIEGDNPRAPGQRIKASLALLGVNLSWRHRF